MMDEKMRKISHKKADFVWALHAMLSDYEATIEVIKTGKVPTISIGQFRRLRSAKDILEANQ